MAGEKNITRHAIARCKPVSRVSRDSSFLEWNALVLEENYIWNNVAFSNWARNYEYAKTHCAPGMLS